MVKHKWLYVSHEDLAIEKQQCIEEGRDISSLQADFERLAALPEDELAYHSDAHALFDATMQLPLRPDFAYHEPDDLASIKAARPENALVLPALELSDDVLLDKLHGAWTGRCVGCLLGKPVENWRRPRLWGYLKDLGRWPLDDYFRYDIATPEAREKYELSPRAVFADRVSFMPEDDDTNYTTTGFALMKKHGANFTPQNVADFWVREIPLLHTCTAERVAYRNVTNGMEPPLCAQFRNPYREWIGAQIRADFFGYACPGDPERAAELAWRDASISHVKNGIYGEMWAAAMIAASFVTADMPTIIQAGLAQIPVNCRLSEDLRLVMQWKVEGVDFDGAVERLHEKWDENSPHDWCHTISNAMVCAIGLLWGENDFGKTVCRAVQPAFDTDCNGATVGSILGIIDGRAALPEKWTGVLHDTLHTGVAGYNVVKLADMARESLEIIKGASAASAGETLSNQAV